MENDINKIDNPTALFGNIDTPYMIIFIDTVGTSFFNGGRNLVIGYTYPNGNYGAQIFLKYTGLISFRTQNNNSWSEPKIITK